MNLLVTFGCSWTFGAGSWYDKPIPLEEYKTVNKKLKCDLHHYKEYQHKTTFRALLAQRHGYHNINFASIASSNQTQMRRAQEYFNTDDYKKYDKVIVLWGISSTARGEAWIKGEPNQHHKLSYKTLRDMKGEFKSFMYTRKKFRLAEEIRNFHYNHEAEVGRLETHMNHWNSYFKLLGVKNYWFDTFNHHDYDVPSMIFRHDKRRDLMSKLCESMGKSYDKDGYHFSVFKLDCDRPVYLEKKGILNPHSLHPTMKGNIMIADILDKEISW